VRIGLARDEAFCFYYEDNLDLLRACGAELVEFSPLKDRELPTGLGGIYLGGGYPELFAEQLAANNSMRTALNKWAADGRPLYGECGGFMYLTKGIISIDGEFQPMCGVFPVSCSMQKRLASLGYRKYVAETSPWWPEGSELFGHEFHYSTIDPMPEDIARVGRMEDGGPGGYRIKNTLAGYMHLHFGRTPEVARSFVDFCRKQAI
jgi:cobyrinic acid a,c-diamide synthase